MGFEVHQERLAEVFRLKVAGLSNEQITEQLTNRAYYRFPVDTGQVERDIAAIDRIMSEYGDPDRARTAIALDLDRLFAMILEDLNNNYNWNSRPAARAEFYKQGAQLLMQKALLFGLNSETVNVSRSTRLTMLVQQLRELDATQLEPETRRLPEPQSESLPAPAAALEGLPVARDFSDGW